MTSFFGTSGVGVCMSVVSNSPGIFLIIIFMLYIVARRRLLSSPLLLRPAASSMVEWLPDRIGRVTLIIFFHLSGPNFALGASYDSIQRSQAVAWCVVSFSSLEYRQS